MENQSASAKAAKKAKRNATIIKSMWWGLAGFFCLIFILFVLIYNGVIGYMPPIEKMRNPERFASTIFTADGVEMGRFYSNNGNRTDVDYNQISQYLKDALIATEDVRFEEHSGVDARAIFRSLVKRIIMGEESAGGGSTLTQQLAKQLYTMEYGNTASNIWERAIQKPIEWVIAIKLERYFTKEEIVKMYLNQFDFLYNAVGIKSAAYIYFGKSPKDLNVQESAMLVGMCKNPSYFNPIRSYSVALQRRNVVLDQMYKANMLTAEQCDSYKKTSIDVNRDSVMARRQSETHETGIAPYFREELRRVMMADEPVRKKYSNINAYKADSANWENNPLYGWCKKNYKSDGSNYNIYTDGLHIYTTIDSKMQEYAEQAVREHMVTEQTRFFHQCGSSYKDPYTRNRSELSEKTKQKVILIGIRSTERYRAMKAEGKTEEEILDVFKHKTFAMRLFDYDKGEIEREMTPLDSMLYMKTFLRCGMMSMDPRNGNIKAYVGGPDFKFFKYDMVATGSRQIGSAMKPFVYSIAMQNGLSPCSTDFENTPPNFGGWQPKGGSHGLGSKPPLRNALAVSSNWIPPRILDRYRPQTLVDVLHNDYGVTSNIPANLTISLGSCEISLMEMVSGYSAFANYGMRAQPMMVTRITDNHGNIVAEFYPKRNQAISVESSYRMVDMMKAVITHGTATSRISFHNQNGDMAGKTGTTNYNADAWWVGFTPELVTGVWFGGEDRYIHFASTGEGQGAAAALPIFDKFMKKVFADSSLPYKETARWEIPADFDMCPARTYDNEEYMRYMRANGGGGGGSGGGGGDAGDDGSVSGPAAVEQQENQEAVNAIMD